MKNLKYKGGLDYTKRTWNRVAGGTSGATYVDVVSISGGGWIYYVAGKNNGGDTYVKFIIDGFETGAVRFAMTRDTSGGYPRHSTGIYNIPFRFNNSCKVQCIYGSIEVIYALD